MKDWYKQKREISRGELLKLCWLTSIPIAGWLALITVMIQKPHDKKSRWK